jgi:hypothetical protein
MTLIIQKPTGAKLNLAQGWDLSGFDADAAAYIQRVEWADTTPLEPATRTAINSFVVGCKSDGIWTAIKSSCILAGARTLSGALMPLNGAAPTNFNFVDGDYDRKAGLVGDGSTKYLSANRTYAQLTQQNSGHFSSYITTDVTTSNKVYIGSYEPGGIFRTTSNRLGGLVNSLTFANDTRTALTTGFVGTRRNSSANQQFRRASAEVTFSTNSVAPSNTMVNVFANSPFLSGFNSAARLSFYSMGESLDLALLDARVTTLINAFAVAIP